MNLKLTAKAQKMIATEGGSATIGLINKVCYT